MSHVVRLEYAYGVCPKCKSANYLRYLIHNDGLTHKPFEIKCTNCNSYFAKEDILGRGEETAPKPLTHYDLLIKKTPEEMAEKIGKSIDCEVCKTMHHSESGECPSKQHQSCVDFWRDWLKQEAKNN